MKKISQRDIRAFQQKRQYFVENPQVVDEIIAASREKCLVIAEETMKEVKEKMGLIEVKS